MFVLIKSFEAVIGSLVLSQTNKGRNEVLKI